MKRRKYPHVDILILNFNGKSLLKRCLESVEKTDYPDFEIFVVDNGSTDGSIEFIREHYPLIKLVEMGRNIGLAAAYNQVINSLVSEFVALLNNDVEVDKNWLKHLMDVLVEANDNTMVATCKIKFLHDKRRINSAGGSCDIYGVGWNRGNGELDNGQYDKIDEPFYSTGTVMVIRRSLWEKVGGFDERYLMYGEDLDWCWRARLLGYNINYVPQSIVYHEWQASRKFVPIVYLLERNWFCTLLKNYSLKTLIFILPKYLMIKTLKFMWLFLRGKRNEKLAIPKAFIWNIVNLRESLKRRKKVQSARKVPDQEIQKRMLKKSFEISLWLGTEKHPILRKY
jgi:GT2 family glycosyltransferase